MVAFAFSRMPGMGDLRERFEWKDVDILVVDSDCGT
jgi:hypothetical protein